jgi:predicted dienelactone hydrolase
MQKPLDKSAFLTAILSVLGLTLYAGAQKDATQAEIPRLLQPSGSFGIGRVAFDWIDPNRPADMAEDPNRNTELMVYVWYPSEAPTKETKGLLFPGAKQIDSDVGVSGGIKKNVFGGNWPLVVSGEITSHTQENAPIAANPKIFPLIVFSPGAFMSCFQYSSAIEDLVSHGYIVAAIEHTYEVFGVLFPNGEVIAYSPKRIQQRFLPQPGAAPEELDAKLMDWSRHRVDVRAADESFVLNRLTQLNASGDKPSQFSGRLDLAHVAAVGHSRGGWASIVACRRDVRFKVCVNEDGQAEGEGLQFPGAPIPTQPILYVEIPPILPKDWAVLKKLHLTADEWLQKWHATVNQEFSSFPSGGYFVQLKLAGLEHYSFTDEIFLRAAKGGTNEKEAMAAEGLRLTEGVTRAFLDEYLKNEEQMQLQDGLEMTVKRFGPKK